MNPPIEISPATEADLEEILAIEQASFPTPWSRELFLRELDLAISRNLVARGTERVADTVSGYMFFWFVAGEGQLQRIAVRQDLRRAGIADRLMEGMLGLCAQEDVTRVMLEVRRSNEAAIGLYRKWGFQRTGTRRGYYPETGEDALLMEWNAP
ncbi:MAG: ribosomal-protein-alanine N-acetyltransferase [Deltaproteobacteria bacterium HGW-Deltaproteobacteria-19]|jgi:ribosomal-protein-alanine N-acetyltransferase|nr:MAG: ribosomal-protein-alanine N-acetyltransferase [Deltaproteobacteria bacterium HGW-Deltaproteobacteria-19]